MLGRQSQRAIDPILSLSVPRDVGTDSDSNSFGRINSISSVCFLPCERNSNSLEPSEDECSSSDNVNDSDSSDAESEMQSFRCRSLVRATTGSAAYQSSNALALNGRFLISAHRNGSTLLWDLGLQQHQSHSVLMNRGPVTLLRRTDETTRRSQALMFQTRDEKGTVSLHDARQVHFPTINSFETHSQTFCAASPCNGHPDLVALPDRQDSVAVVRDWRLPSNAQPVAVVHNSSEENNNGMLMSLGFSETCSNLQARPVLACGMESGKVLWYDLAMLSSPLASSSQSTSPVVALSTPSCALTLGRDPVLSLDVAPSRMAAMPHDSAEPATGGVVAIAGMAAHRADLPEIDENQRGTVAVLKATRQSNNTLQARVRSRRTTCQTDDAKSVGAGKPGVGSCRFRPDGRIFAIGGWDRRLRLFDRATSAPPLAILRGHTDSVNAIDWSPDAAETGILATGADDGRILVWQCSPDYTKPKPKLENKFLNA